MTSVLCFIFFLSGVSALSFEMVWFYLAALTLGNSVWAAAIVLASFMGGLAIGSALIAIFGHRIRRPIMTYAFLEFVIGVSGLGLVLVLPNMTESLVPVFRVFLDQVPALNGIRAFVAMVLMSIPASAMGATLPVLIQSVYRENKNFGAALGKLYGWNTLGAVTGVIAMEFFCIRFLGIVGTGMSAAALNVLAGVIAVRISKKNDKSEILFLSRNDKIDMRNASAQTLRILIASLMSGFTLLALEVVWFRFMVLFCSEHSINFAIMLVMVLAGISIGGFAGSKWFQYRPKADGYVAPILVLNGMLVAVLYASFPAPLAMFIAQQGKILISFASVFLIFPISFLSGLVFTLLARVLQRRIPTITRATSLFTLANTIGATMGSLMAGMLLIPFAGIEMSFFILAGLYGIIGLILVDTWSFGERITGRFFSSMLVLAYLISMCLFPFGIMKSHYLKVSVQEFTEGQSERIIATKEGVTATIQYLRKDILGKPYSFRLTTNGYSMSATNVRARRYMKLYVYLPVALHPCPRRALLICYGCGSTAKALVDTKSLERIDIVDISKDIIELSSVPYPNNDPIGDSRVCVHIEDGRFFLLTNQQEFDLITAEPPPPALSGVASLYTT